MTRTDVCIITAISYADIFAYPLTATEVSYWCPAGITPKKFPKGVEYLRGFYFLAGRKSTIARRKSRSVYCRKKWDIARSMGNLLKFIPTVVLVGVTGGLSVNNAEEGDDIDLFIIARANTLWITRMLVTIMTDILNLRRKPGARSVSDKVCLNMFMSDNRLALPVPERDLFSAHEVLQMVPLFERSGTYGRFLSANRWTRAFAPVLWDEKATYASKGEVPNAVLVFVGLVCSMLEPAVRLLQLWYMRSRRTNEVIREGMIRFHPRDARVWIREKLSLRLKQWDVPLDKIFYQP